MRVTSTGPGVCPRGSKRRDATRLGLVGVDRERVVGPAARVDDVVGAAAERAAVGHGRRRRSTSGRAPRSSGAAPTAAARPGSARRPPCAPGVAGRPQRHRHAVAGEHVPGRDRAPRPRPGAARPRSRRSGRCPPAATSSPSTCHGSIAGAQLERARRRSSTCAEPREAELEERVEPAELERRGRARAGRRRPRRCRRRTASGSRNRSCSSVPQRTSGAAYGSSQNRATSERTSSACTSAICGCGGISKPRSSSRPSRPRSESGLNSLSMQNSARWVLPVMSVSRCRSSRSTCQGAYVVRRAASSSANAISSS